MHPIIAFLLRTLLAGGLAAAILRYLSPRLIYHWLERRLEEHRATLSRQLEEFKIRAQAESDARLEIARQP